LCDDGNLIQDISFESVTPHKAVQMVFTNLKTKKLYPDIPATTFTNETATTTLEISTTTIPLL
jgi:hypothetical protein